MRNDFLKPNARVSHPLRNVWNRIIHCCTNPGYPQYQWYGARGINLCPEWESFETFVADIERVLGERPEGFTLDRIDNDGDYCPENVRWADWKTQNNNRRPRK